MSIPITALMCHAPIVVPDVGKDKADECANTIRAMRAVATRVVAARPDVIALVSPHTPRTPDEWRLVGGDRVRGTFVEFGADRARIDLPAATEARSRLARLGPQYGVQTSLFRPEDDNLDNGATVPLWFLQEAGWSGPTLVIGFPWRDGTEELMGEALRIASGSERWAIIASGDMSHKLRPGSPAGYDPQAQQFDDAVVKSLKVGDLRAVSELDPRLRRLAAEDVVASVTVAGAATGWRSDQHRILGYESPFGVGYCVGILFERMGAPTPMSGTPRPTTRTPPRR